MGERCGEGDDDSSEAALELLQGEQGEQYRLSRVGEQGGVGGRMEYRRVLVLPVHIQGDLLLDGGGGGIVQDCLHYQRVGRAREYGW